VDWDDALPESILSSCGELTVTVIGRTEHKITTIRSATKGFR